MITKNLHISLLALLINFSLLAQPGSLDNSFGLGGMVTTDITAGFDLAYSVLVQPDGKILVAGYGHNGADYDFVLARYNSSNGSLDNTFGFGGKVTTDVGGSLNDGGAAVAIQPDGKIVVAGYSLNGVENDFAIVRYNSDGTPDNTFGAGGKVLTDFGSSLDEEGYAVLLQPDGKIVVTGIVFNLGDGDFALARYNSNGTLDNTFGSGGKVVTAIGAGDDESYGAALQADGRIVMGGYSYNGTDYDVAVVRYNSDGTPDSTFDSDGKVTTALGGGDDQGFSVAIQGDGRIVVAGYSNNGVNTDFALLRYNSDGTLDNSFSSDGKLTADFGNTDEIGYWTLIQGNGKILVAGASYNGPYQDFALLRYNADGTPDNTFDSDGITTTDFGGDDRGFAAVIQNDGKIVVAGANYDGSTQQVALARYHGVCASAVPVCMVTVDSTSTKNVIIWEKTGEVVDSYRIYREVGLNNYVHIGSVGYTALSSFTDTTNGVNPNIQSYRYKISVLDTCGNESALSSAHRTIHLSTPQFTAPDKFDLIWTNDYEGFSISQYYILRDGNNSGNWVKIDSVTFGNLSYTDINAPSDSARYIIEAAHPSGCTATAKTVTVASTISNTSERLTGTGLKEYRKEMQVKIYPNPNSGEFHLAVGGSQEAGRCHLKIYNLLGEIIFQSLIANARLSVALNNIPPGLYQLEVTTKEGVVNRKLVIE